MAKGICCIVQSLEYINRSPQQIKPHQRVVIAVIFLRAIHQNLYYVFTIGASYGTMLAAPLLLWVSSLRNECLDLPHGHHVAKVFHMTG